MLNKSDSRTRLNRLFLMVGMLLASFTIVDLYHHASFQIWLLKVVSVAVVAFAALIPSFVSERRDRLSESEGNKTAEELQGLR